MLVCLARVTKNTTHAESGFSGPPSAKGELEGVKFQRLILIARCWSSGSCLPVFSSL